MSDEENLRRYRDNEELKFSLRSVEKHAKWVRKIFIVTNGQVPNWLNTSHPKIRLVSHDQIFTDKGDLPNFSSVSIECHLHRIEGLSDNFVYFNDDMFLGDTLVPSDFLCGDEQKIRVAWEAPVRILTTDPNSYDTYSNSMVYTSNFLNKRFGVRYDRRVPAHTPYFFHKTILKDMLEIWKEAFENTCKHKLRTNQDMLLTFAYQNFVLEECDKYYNASSLFDELDSNKDGRLNSSETEFICNQTNHFFCSKLKEKEMTMQQMEEIGLMRSFLDFKHSIKKYKSQKIQTVDTPQEENVENSFLMITDDVQLVAQQIKELKLKPKKFVCINDDRRYLPQVQQLISKCIIDFYLLNFPNKSSFEL